MLPAESPPVTAEFASDLALAEAVIRRDRKASAELVQLHADGLIRYLRSRLMPRADLAEDVCQEVFLAALQSLKHYRGTSSLKSWLMGIARHKVEDHYRRRIRDLADSIADRDDFDDGSPPLDLGIDKDRANQWTAAILAELPELYALALRWRYWEQRSAQEMAAAAGRTEKAVERILARARIQFRDLWLARESNGIGKEVQ